MVIWLRPGSEWVGVPNGIVRAAEVETLFRVDAALGAADARQALTLRDAQAQARQIIAAARRDATALIAQAEERMSQAVDAGYEEGLRQAVIDWHEQHLDQQETRSSAMRGTQEKLADIVTAAVERIVQSGPRQALYERALRNVQSLTHDANRLVLRVSPADHEHASAALSEQPAAKNAHAGVELLVDSGLQPGSCVFESEVGILDASLEIQLEGLRAAMQRAVQRALLDSQGDDD